MRRNMQMAPLDEPEKMAENVPSFFPANAQTYNTCRRMTTFISDQMCDQKEKINLYLDL